VRFEKAYGRNADTPGKPMARHQEKTWNDPECQVWSRDKLKHKPELIIWWIVALFAAAFIWVGLGEAWTK
jgi:hypothetical protein